jgi:dTDP-4-amino-4,6-dideoxygalactose transaminase
MIPLIDLKKQYHAMRKDIQSAIGSIIEKTNFIQGEEVRQLEASFAQFCGAKFGLGCDSGTGALELSLAALGVGPGDEVIVPVFTFYASASAIAILGAKPVFVDVEDGTGNIDTTQIERAVTPKTKAIMPVHIFGQPANMEEIMRIAKKHNLAVIEDACQAHGARVQIGGEWKTVGSMGDFGCFSFYPSKNLGAYGDGGMVTTNSEDYLNKTRLLRDCGRTGKYTHDIVAYNKRLDTIQAAILLVKLKKLKKWNQLRRKKANLYDKLFKKIGIRTFEMAPYAESVRHVYSIRVPNRDNLAGYLKEHGVGTGVHYGNPLHLQKAFAYCGLKRGDCPVAEKMSDEVLSLPIYPEIRDSEVKKIVDLIARFYRRQSPV